MLVIAPVLIYQDLRTAFPETLVAYLIQLELFLVPDWDKDEVGAEVGEGVEPEEDAAEGEVKKDSAVPNVGAALIPNYFCI